MHHNEGMNNIHPNAKIGQNVRIGPFATIEADVEIGDDCWIGPNVTIFNGARIGRGCQIFPGAVISAVPQDLKYKGEQTTLEIGDNTIVREFCTLNKGTSAEGKTVIGSRCLLMAYVHVAHDCIVGDGCILANNVTLAGHIHVGNYARLGGLTAVHQFVHIGEQVMVGGGSLVRKDVPPFVMAAREPLSYAGINRVGLRRAGFTSEQIHHIEDIYRLIFVRGHNVRRALEIVQAEIPASPLRDRIVAFVTDSITKRGLMKGFRSIASNRDNPA